MDSFEFSLQVMRSRIFWVWYSLMLVVNLAGSIVSLLLQGNSILTYTCFTLEIIMIFFLFLAIKTEKKMLITSIILKLVLWIEFPLLYLVYREIIIAYFILSIIAITVFSSRKTRVFMIPITFIIDIIVIVYADKINLPNRVESKYITTLFNIFTYLANGVASGVIAYTLIYYYEKRKMQLDDMNRQLKYLATHDPLTDLQNRGSIMAILSKKFESDEAFFAAMLDIDDFKHINDTYGHATGDDVLKTFSKNIKEKLKEKGIGGRYGGEEFLLLFNSNEESLIRQILKSVQEDFCSFIKEKYSFEVSFSGGIGCNKNYATMEEFIVAIDNRLYEAKHQGKHRVI